MIELREWLRERVDISHFVFRETQDNLEIFLDEDDEEPFFILSNHIIEEGKPIWEFALSKFIESLKTRCS